MGIFEREERLIGKDAVARLAGTRVAVFGIGGVGGYVVEALARAGVGALDIVDGDTVSETNINRQIIALHSTVGKNKTAVMAERVRDINPACRVTEYPLYFSEEEAGVFDFSLFDYVVDAVDPVRAKCAIIAAARAAGVPVISCMGTGNKLDPSRFRIADIEKTSVCPLARAVRAELKKRGITGVRAVFSDETPHTDPAADGAPPRTPASISFVPPAAGLLIASEVIRACICG